MLGSAGCDQSPLADSHEEDARLLQMIISPVALLLLEIDAHLINADAADSNDELAGDLMANVPEHLLTQTMPRLFQVALTTDDVHV